MAIPGMSAGTLTAIVTANTTGLTVGLTKASSQITAFSNQVQGKMMANSAAITKFGIKATKAIAALGVALSVISVARFAKFDKAMRQSTAVSNVTGEQFTKMGEMAEQASINLNISADKAARAFYFLGSAGLKANEQMQSFTATALLAKAGVMEMGASSEILVDTMKGFKIPFTESGRVTDVLTSGFINSNMTLTQLGETMGYVSGVARNTNNSLEDTVAVIGLMANVGIKGSRAGTTLRRALINLSAPTSEVRKALDKYVDVYDNATGKMKSFRNILVELVPKLQEVSEEERNMALKMIFGARAITGMTELVYQGAEGLDEFADKLRNSGGTAQEVADKQLMAFSEQLGVVFKKLDAVARKVGEVIAGKLSKLFIAPSSNLRKLTKEFEEFEKKGIDLDKYITEYETLSKKTELSKDEHVKLKTAIEKIAEITPGAITEINKYGVAISVNTKKVKELYNAELQWIRSKQKKAIEETIDAYNKYGKSIEKTSENLRNAKGDVTEIKTEIANYQRQLAELEKANVFKTQQRVLRTNISLLKDKLTKALRGVNSAQRENTKATKDYNTKIDGTLLALVQYFDLSQSSKEIAKQLHEEFGIGIIKSHNLSIRLKELAVSLKTVNEEIIEIKETGGGKPLIETVLGTPDIWNSVADALKRALEGLKNDITAADIALQKSLQRVQSWGSEISNVLYEAFGGQFQNIEDYFKNMLKRMAADLVASGLMKLLMPASTGTGLFGTGGLFGGLFGEHGGLFQNYGGGNINVPAFAGGVSGYQIPSNIPMDTMPVMVGGGEELDVRSIGQVSDRDNLLKKQIGVLNKIVTTLYKTQTQIGDIAIHNAAESGKLKKGESI